MTALFLISIPLKQEITAVIQDMMKMGHGALLNEKQQRTNTNQAGVIFQNVVSQFCLMFLKIYQQYFYLLS